MTNQQTAIRVAITGLISMGLGILFVLITYSIICQLFNIIGAVLIGLGLGVFVVGLANINE